MYQSKACVQKFWYFVPGIDNQPEQSENDNLALKKQLPVAKHVKSYAVFICILTWTHVLVVKVSSSKCCSSGSTPAECWNLQQPLGHFAWHWARQCTDKRAFYIAALSTIFFPFDFISGDLALTGFSLWTWTSDFHCLGTLGVRPGASTRPHVRAWSMGDIGRDYSNCRASEQKSQNCLAFVFPWIGWIVKNTWKISGTFAPRLYNS